MKKQLFTLLEVMISISLLLIISSGIGWKMHGMIEKKRFTTNAEKIKSRLLTCHRLALNMQADWKGVLELNEKKWTFRTYCIDDPRALDLPSFSLNSLNFSLNGEEKKLLLFDFTANGEVFPQGCLRIHDTKSHAIEYKIPDLFSLEQGKKLGPIHPDDLKDHKK